LATSKGESGKSDGVARPNMSGDELANVSSMNFETTDEQNLILKQVDRACKELRPVEDKCYLDHRYNDRTKGILGQAHVLGMPISAEYGDGQGVDLLTYALALERIGREGGGVRTFVSVQTSLTMMPIERWGTPEQKSRYLEPGTKGETLLAFGLTEPGAGSDPSSMRTEFEERGGNFVLNGQKTWISNGSVADTVIVFARPKASSGAGGICAFLVDRGSEGFSAKPIEHKLGLFTSDTGTIYLDNCVVPKDSLLGPRGKGLPVAYGALMGGRLSVAAGCVGVTQDCLDEAVHYSAMRTQHGKLIGKHQLVQRHIAVMAVNLEASKWLMLRAASLWQNHAKSPDNVSLRDAADAAIAKAKYFAANASFDAADRAVQVFGANGYSMENRPARHLIDTRVSRIYEGTDEILQQKIAVSLLGRDFEAYS
jgi:alkylation response protein AidB-like acyl-CoA dehydrogenase